MAGGGGGGGPPPLCGVGVDGLVGVEEPDEEDDGDGLLLSWNFLLNASCKLIMPIGAPPPSDKKQTNKQTHFHIEQ